MSRGDIHDLLINVPPGTTKSLTVGVFWPAWEWTWQPWTRWLTASYDARLAVRDAVRTRRLMTTEWYRDLVQTEWEMASDQNVKGYYQNSRTGWRLAIPLVGAATGEHAHRVIVDDPHHARKAESEAARKEAVSTWREVFPSRVLPGGARVVVGQRVHEQDTSADWLEREGAQIHHLELKMEYETPKPEALPAPCSLTGEPHDWRTVEGAVLAPNRFTAQRLATLKRDLGSYAWTAQYQQNPVPRTGAILDPNLFRPLPADYVRTGKTRVQFWDTAFSEKQTADHTASVTIDATPDEKLFITSVFHERHDAIVDPLHPDKPTSLAVALANHIVATKPNLVGIEDAAFRKKAVADLVRQVLKLLKGRHLVSVRAIPVDGDKVTRARIVEGRAKAGDIYADRAAPWWTAYAAELAAFPMRAEDDRVDATSGAVTMALEHLGVSEKNKAAAAMMRTGLPIKQLQGLPPRPANVGQRLMGR